jgi:hypothetical protein
MPAAETQYGPGVYEEYTLELCPRWFDKRISLWRRIYREYTESSKLKQQDITHRELVVGESIGPFSRGDAPAPPHMDSERERFDH